MRREGELAWIIFALFFVSFGLIGMLIDRGGLVIPDEEYQTLKDAGTLPIGAIAESSRIFSFWGNITALSVGVLMIFIDLASHIFPHLKS